MIILIHGNDEIKSRAKYNTLAESLLAKNPEASLFKLSAENFSSETIEELTKGQGLFYKKFIIGCDNLLSSLAGEKKESEERRGQVKNFIEAIAESENVFILLENNLEEKDLTVLKKLASKEQVFSKKEVPVRLYGSVSGFNIFSITDAFTARNKNRAWALYQEALMMGVSAEEILWKLIWSVNNLLLVKNTKDVSRLKMKPYPLTKAKNAAKTFSNEELKNLSASFLGLYHQTFIGTDEFEFGLERILLSL
jgi:DNA polymerase III delta subunit